MPHRKEFNRVRLGCIELGVSWLVLLFLSLFTSACDPDEPAPKGELVVVVDSELAIPKDVDHLLFEASTRTRALIHQNVGLLGGGGTTLPLTFRVPYPGNAEPVTLRAVASSKNTPRIQREAVTPIPKSFVGLLRMSLNYLCDGTAKEDGSSTCPEGETCILGRCTSSIVSEADLQSEPWPTGGDGQGPSRLPCLDVLSCFDAATAFDVNPATCSVYVPGGFDADATVNVAVQLPPGSAGVCSFDRCWVVLDAGTAWYFDGALIRLPEALCREAGDLRVALSTRCAQKVPARPLCPVNTVGASDPDEPGLVPSDVPAVEGMGTACPGAALRACGNCGSQTRVCTNGTWSDWTECSEEGECAPNSTRECGNGGSQTCEGNCQWGLCVSPPCEGPRSRSCGDCGTQSRVCTDGVWGEWSECSDQGECAPDSGESCADGGTRTCGGDCRFSECVVTACEGPATQSCGRCGTQYRTCDGNGTWSAWSDCQNEGVCTPDARETCGAQGNRICGGSCQWSECGDQVCSGPNTESCGNCGTRRRICNNGVWSEWSACEGQGDCSPNTSQSCGTGGTRTCGGSCQYGACTGQTCSGPATQSCGNCGTQTRTCNNGVWSEWSACTGEGVCTPNATQSCGNGGTQTCTNTCTWGTCGNQQCPGGAEASTRACQNCGTQTRTCNNATGQWSDWGACSGQGECAANTKRACGVQNSGEQTCSNACAWGACTGQECVGEAARLCGNCGTQTRTCNTNTGEWSDWPTACSNEGACTPNTSRGCANGGTQTCTDACQWGACLNQTCPGSNTESCERCGTRTRTCNHDTGMWSDWGTCGGQPEGACERNTERQCGYMNKGKQTCGADCQWSECLGQSCDPAEPLERACGNCGKQTRQCQNGVLTPWTECAGEGVCKAGSTESCGNGGIKLCTAQCTWGTCQECTGSSTQACESAACGLQQRVCKEGQWSEWGECQPQGDGCRPGETRLCSDERTRQQCSDVCKWGPCEQPKYVTLVSGLKNVGPLAVDEKSVYYGYDRFVAKVPLDGGTPTELGSAETLVTSLAVNSSYVYWVSERGELWRSPLEPSPVSGPIRFADGTGGASGGLILQGDALYYFTNNNRIVAKSLEGKSLWERDTRATLIGGLASNSARLYFTNFAASGWLGHLWLNGESPTNNALEKLVQPHFIVRIAETRAETQFAFSVTPPDAKEASIALMLVDPNGGVTVKGTIPQANPRGLASDGSVLYWSTTTTIEQASGDTRKGALVDGLSAPAALAVGGSFVYAATKNAIIKVPR